jgi:hypothetical protein
MIVFITKAIKKFLCAHELIQTETTVLADSVFMIRTKIICTNCSKSFPLHPRANCCHVAHIQHELMREHLFKPFKPFKQTQTQT